MRFRRGVSREEDLEETLRVTADALETPHVSDSTRVDLGLGVVRAAMKRLGISRSGVAERSVER